MKVSDAIAQRRSIKKFQARAVTREEIEALLDAAVLAPNHKLTQPWRFYILGPKARKQYGLALGERKARKLPDAEAANAIREKTAAEYEAFPALIAVATIIAENPETREEIYTRLRRTVTDIAAASGASAEIRIAENAVPVVNPPDMVARARAAAARAIGEENVLTDAPVMPAEDFAYFQREVPGVFFFYGVNAPGVSAEDAAPNHNPRFFVHEPAMEAALRAMLAVALDRVGQAS